MPETLRPAENGEFNDEAGLGTSYRVKLVEIRWRREPWRRPHHVIARSKATKQSSFVSAAKKLDCFAEPVIGRAFARPVGSQ